MLRFAIERGIIVSVVICILMLFGIVAVYQVPVQMTPDVERRVIKVNTFWPGATPQEIESEILLEQEPYLRNIQGLLRMTSNANMGRARINLEFPSDANTQALLLRVNNALSQVSRYPENVDPPQLVTSSSADEAFIFIGLETDDPNNFDRAQLSTIVEKHIEKNLERIPGVSELNVFGSSEEQVHIEVDTTELASRGISIPQFRNAIRARNSDFSGGDIQSGKRRYLVRTIGRYATLDDIRNTVIAERNGQFISVKDVATVRFGSQEINAYSYLDGKSAVYMGLERTSGANVIDILEAVKLELARINQGPIANMGLNVRIYSDDVRYVISAISVVQKNLILGALLACLILFLFLRSVGSTILGALGVPICTIGAFLGLLVMGRTLNVISLAGIAFAIGMTLDNSIVVMENIFRHRGLNKDRFTAALDGVREVWPAVLASTLTTIFVFAPIILIQEEVGQLYSDIAIAISSAIIMSMLVAVAVIPSIAARLPQLHNEAVEQSLTKSLAPLFKVAIAFRNSLSRTVDTILRSKSISLMFVVATLSIAVALIYLLTPEAEYLPEGEENKIFFFGLAPAGYNAEEVNQAGEAYDRILGQSLKASREDYESGKVEAPPVLTYLRSSDAGRAFAIAEPKDPKDTELLKKIVTDELKKNPGFIVFANRGSIFSGNSGGSRSIRMDIRGDDLTQIYSVAKRAYAKAQELLPGVQIRPLPGLNLGQPTIELKPDWQRANELGISAPDLGYTIWSMVDGAYLDEYFLDGEKVDIYLHSQDKTVNHPSDISNIPIYTPSGAVVPLSAITELTHAVSSDQIRRVEGLRTVTLRIVPPTEIPLERAVNIVREGIVDHFINEGIISGNLRMDIGGASSKLDQAIEALSNNILIAVALAYLLMVAIFSHWGFPLIILLNIPLGISGGVLGLWITNNIFGIKASFDMITMLGMIVLIGTVVNNPILLVEQARRLLNEGLAKQDAIKESINIRLRPIMMSMLTTVFGLSPVVFLAGAGTELYRGLGAIVLFGLLFSTFITLTFIPAVLNLVLKGSNKTPASSS